MKPDEQKEQPKEAPAGSPGTGEGKGTDDGAPAAGALPEAGEVEGELASEQQPRRRRPWLVLTLAGVVVLAVIGVAAFFILSPGGKPGSPTSPDARGKGLSAGDTRGEFFIPLSTPGEAVLMRVSFAVEWPEERRIAFLQEQVAIQDEVYQKLYEMTAKGIIPRKGSALDEDYRQQLQREVTRIFERSLRAQDFKVSIPEVLFLPGPEAKAMPEPGDGVKDASAEP